MMTSLYTTMYKYLTLGRQIPPPTAPPISRWQIVNSTFNGLLNNQHFGFDHCLE